MRYDFQSVNVCNMCGADASQHKVMGRRLNQSQGLNPASKTGITVSIVRCTQCSLIFPNPLPIPFSLQDHYGVPPESYWTGEYFKLDVNYFSNEIKNLRKLIPFQEGMKALDIGAGIGKAMLALSSVGFDCYGIEPSKPFFEKAINTMGIDKNKISLRGVEDADFSDGQFDFITFGAVLEHLHDPSAAIKRAVCWLKPNGLIHIEVPSSKWLVSSMINLYNKVRLTDFVSNISPMHAPFHLYEFGLESFTRNGLRQGYEVAFHEYFVCKTYMPKLVDFFIKPYMRFTNTGMQLSIWLKRT